jgi:hypothetical protein
MIARIKAFAQDIAALVSISLFVAACVLVAAGIS